MRRPVFRIGLDEEGTADDNQQDEKDQDRASASERAVAITSVFFAHCSFPFRFELLYLSTPYCMCPVPDMYRLLPDADDKDQRRPLMITLRDVSPHNYRECLAMKVHENQRRWVMTPERSLAAAYVYRDCVRPFAVYNEEKQIGFLMCRWNEEYRSWFLWQLMIDASSQGSGYGREALRAVLQWAKSDLRCTQVVTTCDRDNGPALALYRSAGFEVFESDCESEINLRLTIRTPDAC